MEAGQYLCSLYYLDDQLRSQEYLDARVLIPGLRLSIGHVDDVVFIPPKPLVADRPALLELSLHVELLKRSRFAVFPTANHVVGPRALGRGSS